MSQTEETARVKRLRYRAWHRGMKEMDLILGRFADARAEALSGEELAAFEAIIACSDISLYRWVTGADPVPPEYDSPLLREIIGSAGTF